MIDESFIPVLEGCTNAGYDVAVCDINAYYNFVNVQYCRVPVRLIAPFLHGQHCDTTPLQVRAASHS